MTGFSKHMVLMVVTAGCTQQVTSGDSLNVVVDAPSPDAGHVNATIPGVADALCTKDLLCAFGPGAVPVTLTPEASPGFEFTGWTQDCQGDGEITVELLKRTGNRPNTCVAHFAAIGASHKRTEGVAIFETRTCSLSGDQVECFGAKGGAYDVSAPPPALESQFLFPTEHCYGFVGIDAFPSEDHGQVTLTSGFGLNATTSYVNNDYVLNNLPPGSPLGDIDTATVTTTSETVAVAAPGVMTMQNGPKLTITVGVAPDHWRWIVSGQTADATAGGVICDFPGSLSTEVTPDEGIAAVNAVGINVEVLEVGAENTGTLEHWDDDELRDMNVGRMFILLGNKLPVSELEDVVQQ